MQLLQVSLDDANTKLLLVCVCVCVCVCVYAINKLLQHEALVRVRFESERQV